MLDQMLVTLMEGAFVCVGFPYVVKLCRNVYGSWLKGTDMHFCRPAIQSKVPNLDTTEGMVVTAGQVLSTTTINGLKPHVENYISPIHFQSYWQFFSNHSGANTLQTFWGSSFGETKLENSVQKSMQHRSKKTEATNMAACPLKKVKDFYCQFKSSSNFPACPEGEQHCNLMEISNISMRDDILYKDFSEAQTERESKEASFLVFPDVMCEDSDDKDELNLFVNDCIYNEDGQLVRMFICFGIEQSDTSSVLPSSDSGCTDWDSDCEDFVIFDSSFTGEGNCCTRFDFVCDQYELPTKSETVLQSPKMYCEVSVKDSVDIKLDLVIQEMVRPNEYYTSEKLIPNRASCEETEIKSNKDFISRNIAGQTVSGNKKKKRVCFKPDNELTVTHPLIVWSFAYKQARKGSWEMEALDRLRFQKRIRELDEILTPVLLAKIGNAI